MTKETLGDIWDGLPEVERKMASMVIGQQIPYELYEVYTDLNNRLMKLEGTEEVKHCGDCKYTDHKKSEPPCNSCDLSFSNYMDKNKKVKIDFD